MLNLQLFGTLVATCQVAGQAAEVITLTARPGSLLAFLALARGRYFSRGELLFTLWGEQLDSAHAGVVNTTLWRLRRSVERAPFKAGEIIACDRHGALGMPEEARCVLDVEQFLRLVVPALNKPMERLLPGDIDDLQRGVACYTDDILAGMRDEWALREREKLRRHYMNALGRLMQLRALAGDYPGAIGHAQRILDRDMLREDVHCELMRLLMLNGQRALALRQFERCRDALRRELAIQPMRETLAMYQRIAESAVGHDAPPEPAPAPSLPSPAGPGRPAPADAADAAESIAAARRHLALADEQLRHTLTRITPASPAPPPR